MRVDCEHDAGAGGGVVDQQQLRGVREDVAELADDAVGRDDGLVGLEAVVGAFVDGRAGVRAVGAAGADDLRGDGGGDVVLLEAEQRLQAAALRGVFCEGGLLLAEAGDFLLEVGVLLAGVAEVDVVGPEMADAHAGAVERALEWRYGSGHPVAEERDFVAVGGVVRCVRLHLHGETDGLRQHDGDQHERIFEAREKRVHGDLRPILILAGMQDGSEGSSGSGVRRDNVREGRFAVDTVVWRLVASYWVALKEYEPCRILLDNERLSFTTWPRRPTWKLQLRTTRATI